MTRKRPITRRWDELEPLFDAAFEMDEAERRQFIANIEDTELRNMLVAMLEVSEQPDLMEDSIGRLAATLVDIDEGIEGSRLGAWRVGQLIGSGGMASVFLAQRDDGAYEQVVAIKLLRYGLHAAHERERFVRERRILARLEHPHIARLLDGGFTEAGVPWFALEYVDGQPVTTWCDQHNLDVSARLRLFHQICAAVDFAHRNLVVHRDLKPSNIFIRSDGELKLLDFGIARVLDEQDVTLTRTGTRHLTPAYAAPEQFEGGLITTATDVYSLGVLLHELLTGSRPQRRDDGSLSTPSSLITGNAAEKVAASRSARARVLRRRVSGELDQILAKALQTDPKLRYAGAIEFAADIKRHLRDLPVHAKAPSRSYRLAKFVGRHRVGIGLGLAFSVAIVAGLATTLWQAEMARVEARRADAARDFMLALFDGVTPDESKGRTVSARELLDRGVGRLDETLATEPRLESRLTTSLASAYRQLGDYKRAGELAERGLAQARSPATRADALVERGRSHAAAGRFDEAEQDLREALQLVPSQRNVIELSLADVLTDRGAMDEAQALIEAMLGRINGDDAMRMRALGSLGNILFYAGELDAAADNLREALALHQVHHGTTHTQTATSMHDLGVVVMQQGDPGAAIELFQTALATRETLLGKEHPDVAETEFNLGIALRHAGQRESATEHIEHAVAMQQRLFGPNHPAIANGLNTLAVMAFEHGDLPQAIRHFEEAVQVGQVVHGNGHPTVATMLNNLAGIQRRVGHLEDAEANARRALAMAETTMGANHYLVGIIRHGLAGALADRGRITAALREAREAHAQMEESLGKDHRDTLLAQAQIASLLNRTGDVFRARELAETALSTGTETLRAGHPYLGRLRLLTARLAAGRGDCDAAISALDQADEELAAGGAAMNVERAWVSVTRAQCGRNADDVANAQEALKKLPFVPPDLATAAAEIASVRD